MNLQFAFFTLFALPFYCLQAAETKTYPETLTPKTLSEWKDSRDGKVSICLAVDKTTFSVIETITVRCALRNNSEKPLTILRPFGDSYYAHSAGLAILGPEGAITYQGAMRDYVLGTSSFMKLQPHTVVEETLALPTAVFPNLNKAGLYTIRFQFLSDGYPKQPAPESYWQGQIKAAALTILIK